MALLVGLVAACPVEPRAADVMGCSFEDARALLIHGRRPGWRVLDRSGRLVAALEAYYGPPVAYEQLPKHLILAAITSEDRSFFEHDGVDYRGLLRAAFQSAVELRVAQGGSTITQQTLKNTCFQDDDRWWRKVKELWGAGDLEATLAKQDILYVYLNSIFFGGRAHGIEAAARVYLGKYAKDLTLLESALLIQLLPAPNRYNPHANEALARVRAVRLIDRMAETGVIRAVEAERAKAQKLAIQRPPAGLPGVYPAGDAKGWLAEWARGQAKLALAKETEVGAVEDPPPTVGVRTVRTTLDGELQALAERRLAEVFRAHGERAGFDQGAVLVLDHRGDVLAMVGGRDFAASQWNAATQARRQPGSAFKLFPYLAALEAGRRPTDKVLDALMELKSGARINNFDGRYRGMISLEEAFAHSSNPAAIRLTMGRVPAVIETARRLGVQSELSGEVGLALGISEMSLLELTRAYAVIANGGKRVEVNGLLDIRDNEEQPVWCAAEPAQPSIVAPAEVAAMRKLLAAVVREGTGKAADPGFPAYGKTGTTDDFRDAWFIGFTDRVVVGVWLGNERQVPMKGVTGGGLPAQIFKGIAQDAQGIRAWPRKRPACTMPRVAPMMPIVQADAAKARTDLPAIPVPRPR